MTDKLPDCFEALITGVGHGGRTTLVLDIGHWNWTLVIGVGDRGWTTLVLNIGHWNWTLAG